jgi:hypothetical protein
LREGRQGKARQGQAGGQDKAHRQEKGWGMPSQAWKLGGRSRQAGYGWQAGWAEKEGRQGRAGQGRRKQAGRQGRHIGQGRQASRA